MKQHKNEPAIEFLRRVSKFLDYEDDGLLRSLPSTEAVFDFAALWSEYGTELWDGILGCIADGETPAPARAFVAKYGLGSRWSVSIDRAVAQSGQTEVPNAAH